MPATQRHNFSLAVNHKVLSLVGSFALGLIACLYVMRLDPPSDQGTKAETSHVQTTSAIAPNVESSAEPNQILENDDCPDVKASGPESLHGSHASRKLPSYISRLPDVQSLVALGIRLEI